MSLRRSLATTADRTATSDVTFYIGSRKHPLRAAGDLTACRNRPGGTSTQPLVRDGGVRAPLLRRSYISP